MKKEITANAIRLIEALEAAYKRSREGIIDMGNIIVELIDVEHMTHRDIKDQLKNGTLFGINTHTLSALEKVGRRQILPELFCADFAAVEAVKRLPLSEQERLIIRKETIEVAEPKGDEIEIRHMDVQDIPSSQVQQVFSQEGVKPISTQRSYLTAAKLRQPSPLPDAPFTVRPGRLEVHGPYTFTYRDIMRLLPSIKPKGKHHDRS
jgi:hypothetical protein